jgi:serine/threonine protein kinase
VDWWACGCLLYEMLIGVPPFNGASSEAVFANILKGDVPWDDEEGWIKDCEACRTSMHIRPPAEGTCVPTVTLQCLGEVPDEAVDLITRLLDPNPDTRLGAHGAAEVKAHPFFLGITWEGLREGGAPWVPPKTPIKPSQARALTITMSHPLILAISQAALVRTYSFEEDDVGGIDENGELGTQIAGFYPFSHAAQLAQLTGGKAQLMTERNARIHSASNTPQPSPTKPSESLLVTVEE